MPSWCRGLEMIRWSARRQVDTFRAPSQESRSSIDRRPVTVLRSGPTKRNHYPSNVRLPPGGNPMPEAVAELRTPSTAAPQRVIQSADATIPALKYGSRLRLGMIIPSVCSNAEAHIAAMLPDGVTLHTTRLRMDERDS